MTELGPLPEPFDWWGFSDVEVFDAEQMRAYALQERERCAKLCALPDPDDMSSWGDGYETAWQECQARIRAG